jgi:hypothetical protein
MMIELAEAEARRVRAFLGAGRRSVNLVRLFDYLLDRSQDPYPPKEIEIALDVFGKDSAFDTTQNSMVRVSIHRLRSRLDQFYSGKAGPRFTIPSGEYRILFKETTLQADAVSKARNLTAGWYKSKIALYVSFAANAVFWIGFTIFGEAGPSSQPLATFLKPAASGQIPPIVVTGGFYTYVQSNNGQDVERTIMRPSIQSMADLDAYLKKHPEAAGRLYDLNIYYLSTATAISLWPLLSGISSVRSDGILPNVLPASRVTEQMLSTQNIFYVGQIDELSLFRALISTRSSLKFGSYYRIQDRLTGKMFIPNFNEQANEQPIDKTDYGYIACFSETSGQKIVILTGMQNVAASQIPQIISTPHQFSQLNQMGVKGCDFEALFSVRSLGGLKHETKLVLARNLPNPK